MNKINKGLAVAIFIALLLGGIYYLTGKEENANLRSKLEDVVPPLDTLIFDRREAGNINLGKFLSLIKMIRGMDSTSFGPTQNKDSFTFRMPLSWSDQQWRVVFYNDRIASNWEGLFKNLPVRTFNSPVYGFTARMQMIDSTSYIYLPYEILFSVAKFVNFQNGPVIDIPGASVSEKPSEITISRNEADQLEENKKRKLISTEGIVWKHVSDLLSKRNLGTQSKVTQLCYLWDNAYRNWIYINDPEQSSEDDTWRPASTTIETYYSNGNNKYTGDCDDFAILVASFARQVGLKSRFVGAFNADGGHAFAEFFIPDAEWNQSVKEINNFFTGIGRINYRRGENGNWVNMDWWGMHVGGKYFEGTNKIYDL